VDCYTTLSLKRDASVAEIKKAYRRLAKHCHPDRASGSIRAFTHLRQAYDEAMSNATAPPPSEESEDSDDIYLGMPLKILELSLDGLRLPESFHDKATLVEYEGQVMIKVELSKPWTRGAGNIEISLGVGEGEKMEVVQYSAAVHSRAYRGYGMVALWFQGV
jgi:hypothetical protein